MLIRYESVSKTTELILQYWFLLVIAVAVRIPMYFVFKLYSRLWRYASTQEVLRILGATSIGTLIMVLVDGTLPLLRVPFVASLSVFVVDWILNTAFLSGSRLSLRVGLNWLTSHHKRTVLSVITPHRRVLIAGAGDMGAVVTRLVRDNPEMGYTLVGYVDDDPNKQNKHLHGFPVLGTRHDIPRLVSEHKVDEVILAISTASQSVVDAFREICASAHVPVRVIPSIYDLLTGTLTLTRCVVANWGWQSASRNGGPVAIPTIRPVYRNILVTGGAGFIGTNFVRYMLETYPNYVIVVFDKLTYAGNRTICLDYERPIRIVMCSSRATLLTTSRLRWR